MLSVDNENISASFDGIEIPWNILNPPCNDFPCNDLFFNDLAQPFPRVPQLSSSLNSDLWMEYQTATYNTNFSTDVSYPQDQSCTSLFNNDLSAIQEPLYSSSGLNQQCLSINDLNSSLYTSVVLPTQTQYHWIDSQVLPICDADRSPMDNISLNDQVFLQDMHDTLEIPSSVGPDRITQDNRRSTRVQKKPYEKQIIRKKAVEDRVIDESKVLAPTSPEIGVSSMSLQKPPTKWESRHGFASPDGSWIIATEPEGIKHVPFDKVRPVAAKPGNMYRCRWEQCRYLVFATLSHMRAHMRNTHNIGGNMGIKCQWHPPIRVLIPRYDEPVLTTNHQLSYACNAELHSSSLFNHIDSHLNFERQANPNVIECTSCGDGKVRRGSHRCKGSMSRKNRTK